MLDVQTIIQSGGLLIIALVVFAESGMLVGFVFPGDTLLFSAGIFAAQGELPLILTILVIAFAAILGDNIGYQIGKSMGKRLFRQDSLIFRHDYIMKAESFFDTYGSKTMLVAHFIPIVRTFAPVVAGAAKMNRIKFAVFDAIGDIVWAFSIVLIGYFIGSRIPGIENYIEPVLIAVVIIFLAPTLYHIFKDPKVRAMLKNKFTRSKTPRDSD